MELLKENEKELIIKALTAFKHDDGKVLESLIARLKKREVFLKRTGITNTKTLEGLK